ncbi:MAG: YaaA family protein [Gammaproteobacteria bacterium]|nr:YaaA family protein [Gammaproteobacteria bacterium]
MSLLLLLSPAKKQLAATPTTPCRATQPRLKDETALLVNYLKQLNSEALAIELGISDKLAQLNYHRYQHFDVNHYRQTNTTPALWTFQGDVYRQLEPLHSIVMLLLMPTATFTPTLSTVWLTKAA